MKRHFLTLLAMVLVFSTQSSHTIKIQAEPEDITVLEDGEYEMAFQLLTENEDEESEVVLNEENMAKLIVENGGNEVQITLIPEQDLKIEIQETQPGTFAEDNFIFIDIEEEKSEASKVVKKISFEVERLEEPLNAKVHFFSLGEEEKKIEVFNVRFIFETPQKIEDELPTPDPDPDPEPEPEPDPDPDPEPEPDPDPDPEPDPKPDPEPEPDPKPDLDPEPDLKEKEKPQEIKLKKGKYKNGVYELPFEILKGKNDEHSNTNQYVVNPAKLIVEGELYRVQMTLKNNTWWNYYKVQSVQRGKFKDVRVLKTNSKEDTQLVEFTVQDLDQIMNAKIGLHIKEINYEHQYNIRFIFDTSNLPLNAGYKRVKTTWDKKLKVASQEYQSIYNRESIVGQSNIQHNQPISRANTASLDSSHSPAVNMIGKTHDQSDDNGISEIEPKSKKTIVAKDEDNPLAFDRDADESMPEQDNMDEEGNEGTQPVPQIAGLNMYQVALFSVLLILSIVYLSIQLRKWYKSR